LTTTSKPINRKPPPSANKKISNNNIKKDSKKSKNNSKFASHNSLKSTNKSNTTKIFSLMMMIIISNKKNISHISNHMKKSIYNFLPKPEIQLFRHYSMQKNHHLKILPINSKSTSKALLPSHPPKTTSVKLSALLPNGQLVAQALTTKNPYTKVISP
jgi:hypothetical protein